MIDPLEIFEGVLLVGTITDTLEAKPVRGVNNCRR